MCRRAVVAVLAALLALAAPACRKETPEAAVRRVLDDAVSALERQDLKRATSHLSSEYQDRMGRNARQVSGIAFVALRRGPVFVLLRDTKVEVDGGVAKVSTTAYAVQRKAQVTKLADLVPEHADRFDLRLVLALEGSDWRVRSIDGDNISPEWVRE
jgi:hypothetical protein